MQYWTNEQPCGYCGATSNTSHPSSCVNSDLYTEEGRPLIAQPLPAGPDWEQLKLVI